MGMPERKKMPQARKPAPASKRSVRQRVPFDSAQGRPRQGSGQARPAARKRRQGPRFNQNGLLNQFPAFTRCTLMGPDGTERPGWEMWVGETLFGRADSKESLLQYYARLREPMPTGHWKERSWYTRRLSSTRSQEEEEESEMPELWE